MTDISPIRSYCSVDPNQKPEDPAGSQAYSSEHTPASAARGENNAERTKARSSAEPYADAGLSSSMDALFAGFALVKNHNTLTGMDVEVMSGSGQIGGEMELQAGLGRLGYSSTRSEISAEVLTARYSGGAHNDDGSTGFNVGAGVVEVGAEVTLNDDDGNSLTLGAAISAGAGLSLGIRDRDRDGRMEWCVKVSSPLGTLGACVED